MKRSFGLLALSVIVASTGLFFSPVQGQDLGQQVDPSTPYGQSVIQNEQDHQQELQNQQRDQQNWQEYQQREQNQMDQLNQQQGYAPQSYGNSGYQAPATGGRYGAIYVKPGDLNTYGYSYNFSNIHSGKAEAMGQCYRRAGLDCKEAIVINNTCAALAVGRRNVWAARSASSAALAADMATTACHAAGGGNCSLKVSYCSI